MSAIANIEKKLAKAGYNVTSTYNNTVLRRKGRDVIQFTYAFDDLPHCCGAMELGAFNFNAGSSNYAEFRNAVIQHAFLSRLKRLMIDEVGGDGEGHQLPICVTNGAGPSSYIEEALSEIPKYWKPVSKHRGLHGRKLTIWIAKPYSKKELAEIRAEHRNR